MTYTTPPYFAQKSGSPDYDFNQRHLPKVTGTAANQHRRRVMNEVKAAGITKWGLLFSDPHALPQIIHPDEHIEAMVYGHGKTGWGMIVATDRRVMFVDKKPGMLRSDDITYELVGGVTIENVGVIVTVTLHTRIGDYSLRTTNRASASKFTDYIELRCLEHLNGKDAWDDYTPK